MMEDDTNDDSTDGKYAESPSIDIPRQKGSKAYLSPLMAQGYIAQTLPKKPKSPLQRYRLTLFVKEPPYKKKRKSLWPF